MPETPAKNVRLPQEQIDDVQRVADKDFGGNWSLVVRKAVEDYLQKRGIKPEAKKSKK